MKMDFLLNMGIFQCHVSFQGRSFLHILDLLVFFAVFIWLDHVRVAVHVCPPKKSLAACLFGCWYIVFLKFLETYLESKWKLNLGWWHQSLCFFSQPLEEKTYEMFNFHRHMFFSAFWVFRGVNNHLMQTNHPKLRWGSMLDREGRYLGWKRCVFFLSSMGSVMRFDRKCCSYGLFILAYSTRLRGTNVDSIQ